MMWQLIIPPIILAISGGLLVWLFLRKRQNDPVRRQSGEFTQEKGENKRKGVAHEEKSFLDRFEMRAVKISSSWVQLFARIVRREKGGERDITSTEFRSQKTKVNESDENRTGERKTYQPQKKDKRSVSGRRFADGIRDAQRTAQKEKSVRPMVSEMATQPSKRQLNVSKDTHEQLLVERIALNPRDIEAYEQLGDHYIDERNYEDAKECYKQVLRLNPHHRGAKTRMRRLERILEERGFHQ